MGPMMSELKLRPPTDGQEYFELGHYFAAGGLMVWNESACELGWRGGLHPGFPVEPPQRRVSPRSADLSHASYDSGGGGVPKARSLCLSSEGAARCRAISSNWGYCSVRVSGTGTR